MAKYILYYGLGGGFGGAINTAIEDFEDEYEASEVAFQYACDTYEFYEGMYGLRSATDIMEEEDVDEEEAYEMYQDEREGWLDYYVEEFDPSNERHLSLLDD